MAKISDTLTLTAVRDIESVTWYYQLKAGTSAPAKPTVSPPPSPWQTSEPAYTAGDTKYLFTVERTIYTDGTFEYTVPTMSSAYEAAKQAYNEAQNAKKTATNFMSADELGIMVADMRSGTEQTPSDPSGRNVLIGSDSVEIRDGSDVLARFGEEVKIGQDGGNQMWISSEKLELETNDGITMVDIDSAERTAAVGASDLAHMTFDGHVARLESSKDDSLAFEAFTNPGTGGQVYEETLASWSTKNTIPMMQIYTNGFSAKAGGEVAEIISARAVIKVVLASGYVDERDKAITVTCSDGIFNVPAKQDAFGINPMAAEICQGKITVKYRSAAGSGYSVAFSNEKMAVDWDGIPHFTNPAGSFASVFDLIYPVGSIYMSANSVSPETLFGGTWEQIQNRFLLAAGSSYTAGATGGEATHKLTIAEMPSHTHVQNQHRHSMGAIWSDGTGSDSRYVMQSNRGTQTRYTGYSTPTNQNTGGGGAHNNMPPYLAVYVWKRTA